MEVDIVKKALILLCIIPSIAAQESLCSYFTAIPKEDIPADLQELNLTDTTWSSRPLLPPPARADLCMDLYSAPTQIIYIDEEIEGDVVIAKLNYEGTEEPYIGRFYQGTRNLLGAVVRRLPDLDNGWYLVITERQDYETPTMRLYLFELNIEGESLVARVSLSVVNIDDNAPVIQVFDTCVVPELGTVPRLTDCVYEVYDVDGEISTRFMTFRIDSQRDDDVTFSIHQERFENDPTRINMTIQLEVLLDIELSALHIFSVTASDSLPNNHTVSMMVQVENVEHRSPRWLEIWAVQQFDEKTEQTFSVRAIDGDTGIDKAIYYRLEGNENYPFFSIETLDEGRGGGLFHVDPIDRDSLEQEVFQLSIVAYKFDNETFATTSSVVIIVNDVNDQFPEPLQDLYTISIPEETPLTLAFEDEFGFHDRDLGEHAQYQVTLVSVSPPGAAAAFYIAPEVGYQRQTFTLGTANHSMLDYEAPEFQRIELLVVATDLHTPSHVGNATVIISLINWNDEEPVFPETSLSVTFDETEGEGFYVATVTATDRDIDDVVIHSLLGNAVDFLTINSSTGDIHVSANESFDYHRQNEFFVQVRAEDTLGEPYHTTTAQLVIQLNDINNTPPTLRLPRGSPQVEENVPAGHVITAELAATDPDSTAELVFEIDWATSYATKQGREADAGEYHNCVEIETVYPEPSARGAATGRVVVREIRDNVTIDFEMFEVMYLTVRVRDLNTVIGDDYDEQTFTVIIVDMNDNPPVWVPGSLEAEFRVREVSLSGVVIGSVLATDIDGPLYNQVRYTIFPREDTPNDLVKIDFYTGQLSVDLDSAIDADEPRRESLLYTVVASDWCYAANRSECPPDPHYWDTPGNITIQITDTNNKQPVAQTQLFDTTVYIYENASSGDEVLQLVALDLDRDEIYHTVRYQINYGVNSRLRDFFAVDLDTGLLHVEYTTDEVLDRDGDESEHQIFITLYDNFYSEGDGNRNQQELDVRVVLLDVNDNAPELPARDQLSWSVSEILEEGVRLEPDIYAPDRDEPNTDNSRVGYEILSLTSQDRDLDLPDLFRMVNVDNVTGELETAMDLRGYWGTYDILIRAYDHGIPQQSSNETYELVIRPYNFEAPVFVYPTDNLTVRLAKERSTVNGVLVQTDGSLLPALAATDGDGLAAGEVSFHVAGDEEAQQYFSVANYGDNSGALLLTQTFPEDTREFQLVLRATDGGTEPAPRTTDAGVTLVFVPTQGDPVFSVDSVSVGFVELEQGLLEEQPLPLAEDPKNYLCTVDCHDVFYRIVDGNDAGHFTLDARTNVLRVATALDRNVSATHALTVAAGNSEGGGGAAVGSTLAVTVVVREANPRPRFARALYTAGISTIDSIGRELLVLEASHSESDTLEYTIDRESMVVDPSLEATREVAFLLDAASGALVLNIQPSAAMHGMYEFDALATDTAGASDRTSVKVYLISDLNRVSFVFNNTVEQVEENRAFIADTLSEGFGMACNVDQVSPAADATGAAQAGVTELRAHFIVDDVPVEATVIEALRSDTRLLLSIELTLNTRSLYLQDFVTGSSPAAAAAGAGRALLAVTAALAALCVVLAVLYFVRTRALNRRLQALSTTKFGSLDSGLNRAGAAVPGTNKHAAEGSNPVWNEMIKAPDFDALSEDSFGSDLIGVEELPQFQYGGGGGGGGGGAGGGGGGSGWGGGGGGRPSDLSGISDTVANHNNDFGVSSFKPSYFGGPHTNL